MQHSTLVLLTGAVLMAVILQASALQCSHRRDYSSEERFGCRGLAEGQYVLNDADGCDDDFLHCKNGRLTKYQCSYGCVFSETANKCVGRFTVPACQYDD